MISYTYESLPYGTTHATIVCMSWGANPAQKEPNIMSSNNRVNLVMSIARNMAETLGWQVSSVIEDIVIHHDGYCEPGYDVKESGLVATGNWNKITKWNNETKVRDSISDLPERLFDILTKLGVECEWSDEWSSCSDCGKLVRTTGDSYHWQPSFTVTDDGCICLECIDPADHLSSLEDNDQVCNTFDSIDPEDHDYSLLSEHESGWYGTNDSPVLVAKKLRDQGISRFLFSLNGNEQFRSNWSVYVHTSEYENLTVNVDCIE